MYPYIVSYFNARMLSYLLIVSQFYPYPDYMSNLYHDIVAFMHDSYLSMCIY